MTDIALTVTAVAIVRLLNNLINAKFPVLFKMTFSTIVYLSVAIIVIFIFLKSIITKQGELVPVDLSRISKGEITSVRNIFSSKFLLLLGTEVFYSVIFVLVDGILDKAIKINRGEESVNGLVNDFKLKVEEDRQKRTGKFKSYLPSQRIEEDDGIRKRHRTQ
uniref:Uncharacterized protein n=1 Tax=Euplotes crassus TaxID=5936 RepID=A0A7S3KDU4_EUPCR|mmetsp:Transcript_19427/g.19104  ORF Transcript_19427/g.19104 Transcript_19427/m.19104 type:complete len:163 (+) Transcript_19427:214-702(+)